MRRRLNRDNGNLFEDNSDPMGGVSNLADAMLVLAVGLMLALIMNQHISINGGYMTKIDSGSVQEVDSSQFIEAMEGNDGEGISNLEEQGTVYIDRDTGEMYLVRQNGE